MSTYKLNKTAKGYYTSYDAKNKKNSNSKVPAGIYQIYNQYIGMINITKVKGTKGWWINPTESPKGSASSKSASSSNNTPSNSKKVSKNEITVPYDGSNKSTVYSKNPHYLHPKKEDSVKLIITNLVTTTTMEIDTDPSGMSRSNTANFDGQEIRGRSAPVYGYNSTGPRTLSFSVDLFDDYCYYGVLNTVRFLEALEYPLVTTGIVTGPRVFVKYGKMVSGIYIVNSVTTNWSGPKIDGYHKTASVSLGCTEINDVSLSASDVEKGSDLVVW